MAGKVKEESFYEQAHRVQQTQRLERITELLGRWKGTRDPLKVEVSCFMSDVRQLLEHLKDIERGNDERFSHVRLFCHLCVHIQLDALKLLYVVLDDIHGAIQGALAEVAGERQFNDAFMQVIPGALSPQKLRAELTLLLSEYALAADVLEADLLWENFMWRLAELAAWKPMQIPRELVTTEIERMGGVNADKPAYIEPAADLERNEKRALKYFRHMAALHSPLMVPISIQLCTTVDLCRELEREGQDTTMVRFVNPGPLCWSLFMPTNKNLIVPFAMSGASLEQIGGPPPDGRLNIRIEGWRHTEVGENDVEVIYPNGHTELIGAFARERKALSVQAAIEACATIYGYPLRLTAEARHRGPPAKVVQPGRNDPCTCGSGRKWKYCHGAVT